MEEICERRSGKDGNSIAASVLNHRQRYDRATREEIYRNFYRDFSKIRELSLSLSIFDVNETSMLYVNLAENRSTWTRTRSQLFFIFVKILPAGRNYAAG